MITIQEQLYIYHFDLDSPVDQMNSNFGMILYCVYHQPFSVTPAHPTHLQDQQHVTQLNSPDSSLPEKNPLYHF